MTTGIATGIVHLPSLTTVSSARMNVPPLAVALLHLPTITVLGSATFIPGPPTLPPPTSSAALASLLGDDPGLNRLYDNVLVEVPSVTLQMVQVQAWNTIEDFYLRSTVRREVVYWTMAPGVQQIDFNPYDENWLVAWVLEVCGLPCYRVVPPGVVIDTTNPTSQRNGSALLALKPVANGFSPDPLLFQTWFETLLAGVLSRLYGMPAKPYTSPQLAQKHASVYTRGIAIARAFADGANGAGPGRWRFPYFAAGRRKH